MLYETRTRNYNKHMLMDCVKFREGIAGQSFVVNNFADFPDLVRVKEIKISFSRWWRLELANIYFFNFKFLRTFCKCILNFKK